MSRDALQTLQEEYSRLYLISEREVERRFNLDKHGIEWFFGLTLGVSLGIIATVFTLIFG